jgi:Ca-activated chloride channel family protein
MKINVAAAAAILILPCLAPSQDAPIPTFRVASSLVEVYATVQDGDGHYVDGLSQDRFEIRDNGEAQPILTFDAVTEPLSCAVLLDTTGSMAPVLPTVKTSVMRMIDDLRDRDRIALFSFNTNLSRLQGFTTDRAAAKQAVLRTRASGATALFDSISAAAREIEKEDGKKALVLFTDGDDNASILNMRNGVQRAKRAGIPVYTIAEGDALNRKELMTQLKDIAESTGARLYEARKTSDITAIFLDITSDLKHTYMLQYKEPPSSDSKWRTIEVRVGGVKSVKIRARQGYLP